MTKAKLIFMTIVAMTLMLATALLVLPMVLLTLPIGIHPKDIRTATKQPDQNSNFTIVPVSPNDPADALKDWLAKNPNKRVSTFAGILYYREGVSGFLVYFTDATNKGQWFVQVPPNDQLPHLCQQWLRYGKLMAMTSIPYYGDGSQSYVLLFDQEPLKEPSK